MVCNPQSQEGIAIVGMSCRLPQSETLDEFWNLLVNGKDATSPPPDFRWLQKDFPAPLPVDWRTMNAGFLKHKVDEFDVGFFEISPKEAVFMDPQQRLLHEIVWEGLEDAGIDPSSLKGTNGGVFTGSWTNDYKDILLRCGYDDFYRRYMGNSIGAAAAKISFLLGMTGPCIASESGCSSAMVAVHMACKSLRRGETNIAIATGVNLLLKPYGSDELPLMISPEGRCKPFDIRADGFGRAEGGGVLVLKRLSDAIESKDRIWAVIKGSAITQEGMSKSMGTPTIHSESLAMELALKDAEIDPSQVSYVEAHGTGTVIGDPMEISAISKAYFTEKRTEPLIIGSVKGNVGHTESTSGITGIIRVVLSLHHNVLTKQVNFQKLNHAIDLSILPAEILRANKEWKCGTRKRIAGVSSFGITGTDVHVILEEPPCIEVSTNTSERPLHLMKISGKTEEALQTLIGRYKNHMTTTIEELSDLAFTANTGRSNFKHRAVIVAKSKEDAVACIESDKIILGENNASSSHPGKICFLFTGQGSQYKGMSKGIYDSSPVFKAHFDVCDQYLIKNYGIDIKEAIWGDNSHEISRTIYSQTSIFCVEYALLKLWESWGVKPDYVLGHSLGEFASAVCAKVLSVEDALKLIAERSILIDKLPRGKMLVIKADKKRTEMVMYEFHQTNYNGRTLDYAAVNSKDQTVVAGETDLILAFSKWCDESGLKNVLLQATHAFHSRHMDPILGEYRKIAQTVKFCQPESECKYISGMLGKLVDGYDNQINEDYLVRHTRDPVSFLDASQTAFQEGCNIFVEIGPQPVLSALAMMNSDTTLTCLPSLRRNEEDWSTILKSLGTLYVNGVNVDWNGFDKPYSRKRVQLPHYPFIGKKYWPEVSTMLGAVVHPLLGHLTSSPLTSKSFHSNLSPRSLPYLLDHVVGEHIVFPGAGYLEICLAAGIVLLESSTESLIKSSRPVTLTNLSIEAPLVLDESSVCELHSVVDFGASPGNYNDVPIKVYHRQDSKKWVTHATASFETNASNSTDKEMEKAIASSLSITSGVEGDRKSISDIYAKLANVGLNFGSTFLSLDCVWKNEESQENVIHTFKVREPSEEAGQQRYVIHPVVLDAMIQAIIFSSLEEENANRKKLFLPVKIGKFVLLPTNKEYQDGNFVHVLTPKIGTAQRIVVLTDSIGQVKCTMSQVEFVQTTMKNFDAVVRQQTISAPELWEESWKEKMDFSKYQCDLEQTTKSKFYSEELVNVLSAQNDNPPEDSLKVYKLLKQFSYLHMSKALLECGWEAKEGDTFETMELCKQLGIVKEHHKYFEFILTTLEEEGMICKMKGEKWQVERVLPPLENIKEALASPIFREELVHQFKSSLLLSMIGQNLSAVLQGKLPALGLLFPTMESKADELYPSAADYYEEYVKISGCANVIQKVLEERMKHFKKVIDNQIIRILEVGAGTGGYTETLLQVLEEAGVEYEYTYTDISPSFFPAAEKKFEKYAKHMKFMKFNIEEDPLDQGFAPEFYDYICGFEVIHTTRSIEETLANLRMILKPFGKLDILETTTENTHLTYVWGLLNGYWRFQDTHLRKKHCTLDITSWNRAFTSAHFEVEQTFSTFLDHHSLICTYRNEDVTYLNHVEKKHGTWIIFHTGKAPISEYLIKKLLSVGRKVVVVLDGKYDTQFEIDSPEKIQIKYFNNGNKYNFNFSDLAGVIYSLPLDQSRKSQDELLQPLFQFTKEHLSHNSEPSGNAPKLFVLTLGNVSVGDGNDDMAHFHSSTIWGFCKALGNETLDLSYRCIDMEGDCPTEIELRHQAVFQELFCKEKDLQVAFRGLKKYVPKLQSVRMPPQEQEDLILPSGTDRFQLTLPETKSIDDLKFAPLEPLLHAEDEIEIEVKATALNFRDVFVVLKPSDDFKSTNALGIDFAGEVKKVGSVVSKWKPGDLVCGLNFNGVAMPSHVTLHEDLVVGVPKSVTLNEAATLPTVFATAYHCLVEIARVKPSDYVLLHTASGGVGLVAIDICKSIGAKIIATAGSKVKRRYLRSLGIEHVFHSRNTSYSKGIMKATNGHGVDVVLNSLTSEGFKEATLSACARGSRFVEMSKLSIWTGDEVKVLRPDVKYTIADISNAKSEMIKKMMGKLDEYLTKNIVKPLPYTRFNVVNIRQALKFLQKAKHIGKVVCSMPEFKQEAGQLKVKFPMFNVRSTYLVTGGLGGIGLRVGTWLVEKGARHVILAGRSPPTPEVSRKIAEINKNGEANVVAIQLDIGDFEDCQRFLKVKLVELGMPPLRGVMHAAGVLADGLVVNQTWEKLSRTFNAKVDGTLNLHKLTKDLNLEFFVLFSSLAAAFGSPGQCNHSAANQFEDGFAHYRRSIGLPATTINWGPWCEVGVATDVDFPGIRPITNEEGLLALEFALKSHRVQTMVLNVDSFSMFQMFLPQINAYIEEVNRKQSAGATKIISIKPAQFWSIYDSKSSSKEKQEFLKYNVKNTLKFVLKMSENDVIGDDAEFEKLGVDSLMFVEIRNRLQAMLGDRLVVNVSILRDGATPILVTKNLFAMISQTTEKNS